DIRPPLCRSRLASFRFALNTANIAHKPNYRYCPPRSDPHGGPGNGMENPDEGAGSCDEESPWERPVAAGDDLFVSYARADNRSGWIERFLAELAGQFRELTGGRELRWFFDRDDIRNFTHWESEIFLKGLAQSKLFLAFLSPSYFASEVCRRE